MGSTSASAPVVTSAAPSGSDNAAVTLPALAPPLLNAAVAALPSGSVTGVASATVAAPGPERSGSVLHTVWGGSVTVVLTTGGGDTTSSPTYGYAVELLASATKDGLTALVAADAASAAHLTQAQLDAVAAAVLGAVN
jgi:hypothetical protein